MKAFFRSLPLVRRYYTEFDNGKERTKFVIEQLQALPENAVLLDAGCGSQPYRRYCSHLVYKAQDVGSYVSDEKRIIGGDPAADAYRYGSLDYVGDIWDIQEADAAFDAVLCTEVLEHIPYPNAAVAELARLLKPGGKLILTAPSSCLRHMDPYFFYSGFSDRWFEKVLGDNGMRIDICEPVGDYYSWLAVELARTARSHSAISKLMLAPAFLYYLSRQRTETSVNTLCMGYHVVATKL